MEVIVDKEFKAIIPPLSTEERRQLEDNLVADGCREPLTAWAKDGSLILLDGHNRLEICQSKGIAFDVKQIAFDDRASALLWIIRNQFGRRNLSTFQRAELALKMKDVIAAKAKENNSTNTKRGLVTNTQAQREPIRTRDELAKIAGVSASTITQTEAVLEQASPEVIDQVRSGKKSVSGAYHEVTGKSTTGRNRLTERKKKAAASSRLKELVEELHRLTDKPSLHISLVHVKAKVAELREYVATMEEDHAQGNR